MTDDFLIHYGLGHDDDPPGRGSGRYEYGSGDNPGQHQYTLSGRVNDMRRKGLGDGEIAKALGYSSSSELRSRLKLEKEERWKALDTTVAKIYSDNPGISRSEVARRLGKNERQIRDSEQRLKMDTKKPSSSDVKDILQKAVDEHGYINVTKEGVPEQLGVSKTNLTAALQKLKDEGYVVETIQVPQMANRRQMTTLSVLAKPGSDKSDISKHRFEIKNVFEKEYDTGNTNLNLKPIKNISSKRIQVAYAEDGGTSKDGVIEIRPGAKDLDLGAARYAQVRIGVDGTHYLKGMAMYAENLPEGIDIRFNTNKHRGTPLISDDPKRSVLKPMKTLIDGSIDTDNPFGSYIKAGGQRGALNIVNEQGDWEKWSKTLSSQFLSKQPKELAKRQLGLSQQITDSEYDEIMSLTNPIVKKNMLMKFADECDSKALYLKAAAMPGQSQKVILPIVNIKENEIFAPGYENGERVVLIRHPHAGRFELPELTVNNRNRSGLRLIGNDAPDAVGIHPKVAEKLSGADFDGDSVTIIPNRPTPGSNQKPIKVAPSLPELKDFDPKEAYPYREGMKVMTKGQKGQQMGQVSNLITDMTIHGAPNEHLARAARHSMVVIDAEKHKLDYVRSYEENGIKELEDLYRSPGKKTLISQAKSPEMVEQRAVSRYRVDPETGEKIYKLTGAYQRNYKTHEIKTDKEGNPLKALQRSSKMAEAKDARTLMSGPNHEGTPIERIYADYANAMKAKGNEARKAYNSIRSYDRSPSAAKTYANEVESLDTKLRQAKLRKPQSQKATLIANEIYSMKLHECDRELDKDDIKTLRKQCMAEARARTGYKAYKLTIEPREWEAIQAHAISKTKLEEVLKYADADQVRKLALPKSATGMSPSKISLAKSLSSRGFTLNEIAQRLGVSPSTISKALHG